MVGSIEGRCGIKNYDTAKNNNGSENDFCFKCHREDIKNEKKAEVYPVNGFTFNTEFNTFASFGGDGTINTWNKDTKSKYRSSKKIPAAIVAADFIDDGSLIAYAAGYDWIKGFEG